MLPCRTLLQTDADRTDRELYSVILKTENIRKEYPHTKIEMLKAVNVLTTARDLIRSFMHPDDLKKTQG